MIEPNGQDLFGYGSDGADTDSDSGASAADRQPRRIDRAMVLAAGLGTRLRPITESTPKALVPIAGKPLIDHALDHLADFGVADAVVNTHHLADQIHGHLARRHAPRVAVSHEPHLLGVGGGIANALPLLGDGPFYVVNTDSLWLDGPTPALHRLAEIWDDRRMDALLLLMLTPRATGTAGLGDFFADPFGRLTRRSFGQVAPFVYAGVQVTDARLFDAAPAGAFSLAMLWDRALAAGRLWGVVHDGAWFHIATPDTLTDADRRLAEDQIRWLES